MKGTVKWFNIKKGFGFINGEDGKDYFAHFSAIPQGVTLRDDDAVTFDAAETEKGLQAQNISLGSNDSSSKEVKSPSEGKKEEVVPESTQEDTEDF